MKICVLGAGVVGLTTAYYLSEAGHDVVIVDRNDNPGAETSFANGAQLSYSYVAPLATPDTLRKLPELLLSSASPIRIKPQFDLEFFRWGIDFLRACQSDLVTETTLAQLALAALSRDELNGLNSALGLDFGLATNGKLVIFRKPDTFNSARKQVERQRAAGSEQQLLSARECLDNEPGLKIDEKDIQGGVFTASEQVGDCRAFCMSLGEKLRQRNSVEWRMGTLIGEPRVENGRIVAVSSDAGDIEADVYVLAMGSGAHHFAKKLGFRLPIYPLKGYSITVRPRGPSGEITRSVTDFDYKIVFAPLSIDGSPAIRVAGIADLAGYNMDIEPHRLAAVTRLADEVLDIDLDGDIAPWVGLRPSTPDSRPIIGWSPISNLFLNAGHGALGWTLACGSARLSVDLITQQPASVRSDWFALGR